MKPHFSEADLLETYYTAPGQSMPVMMHLADCTECAARYERLEAKMRGLHSCHHDEKPDTFWARQRISIMRRIETRRERLLSVARVTRVAAAAMLVFVLGALATWNRTWNHVDRPSSPAGIQQTTAAATATPSEAPTTQRIDNTVPADPWESEALNDYSAMVEWESWVEDGDQSS
jgi:anti-sigma factor RsiW